MKNKECFCIRKDADCAKCQQELFDALKETEDQFESLSQKMLKLKESIEKKEQEYKNEN